MKIAFNPLTGQFDLTGDGAAAIGNLKGQVANVAALPSSGNTIGDVWQVAADLTFRAWDGTAWVNLGTLGAVTNLSYTASTRLLECSTGDDVTLPLVTPSAAGLQGATGFSTLTYSATTDLDMAVLDGQVRTLTLTGNLTLTSSSRANGRRTVIRLLPGASQRTLTFPNDWVFVSTKPANLAANKSAVLSLTFFGTTDADCIAAYSVQP